jgi:hypothetical protein
VIRWKNVSRGDRYIFTMHGKDSENYRKLELEREIDSVVDPKFFFSDQDLVLALTSDPDSNPAFFDKDI